MKFRFFFKTIFVLIVLCIMIFIYFFRASKYHYNTSQNYQYNFDQSDSRKLELKLNDGILHLPKLDSVDQTIFCKIKVRANILGKIIKPSIDIISGQQKITHYFEYGAEGIRYLNISNLVNSKNLDVSINGNWINIEDQIVELMLFENKKIDTSRVLFIAPHPDDAEIAAFGLYAKDPKRSFIITITAGEAGPQHNTIYDEPGDSSLKKGEIRTWNSIIVPLLSRVPIENSLNLGFFDGTLKEMYADDTLCVTSEYLNNSNIELFRKFNLSSLKDSLTGKSNWISLVKNLKTLINTINPEIIVTPHPQLDSHPDHKFSTIAVIQALKGLNIDKGSLFLYTNHYDTLSGLYPFGKEGNPITLPPYFKNDMYFKSIFSNPLTISQQNDKIFVLDAMNDLRPGPEWRNSTDISKLAIKSIAKEFLGIKNNYFSSSVRSNELFFVVPINKNELNNLLNTTIIK